MSYTSNYNLNIRVSALESRLAPYPPPADIMTLNTPQTATAVKTFTVLPQSSVVPTNNDDLVNKAYADALATETLQQVLDNGNTATDQTITLTSTSTPATITSDVDSITMDNVVGGSYSSNILIENPTTYSQAVVNFDAVGVATAEAKLKSQSNQTEYSTSVVDIGNNLSATKTLITIGGAVLDTDTATNTGTGAIGLSNRTTTPNGANTGQQLTTGTGIVNSISTTCDATVANQQNQYKTTGVDEYTASISASGSGAGLACSYQTDAPNTLTLFNSTANTGGSSAYVQASNLATGSAHLLRLETPLVGGAVIEHQVVGANRNLTLSTTGNLLMTSDNLNVQTARIDLTDQAGTPSVATIFPTTIQIVRNDPSSVGSAVLGGQGRLTLTSAEAGGTTNASFQIQNTNATGQIYAEYYKNKPTAGVAGDSLFQQSVFGKDGNNTKQEYTRMTHTIRNPSAGAEDGSLEIGCLVDGAYANFIQLNGNDALGEVNILRPVDLTAGSNGTIKVSGTGSTNFTLDATTSVGTGAINLQTKNGVAGSGGGLIMSGNTLTSTNAGGSSGHHMCLTLPDPVTGLPRVYKIALLDP